MGGTKKQRCYAISYYGPKPKYFHSWIKFTSFIGTSVNFTQVRGIRVTARKLGSTLYTWEALGWLLPGLHFTRHCRLVHILG